MFKPANSVYPFTRPCPRHQSSIHSFLAYSINVIGNKTNFKGKRQRVQNDVFRGIVSVPGFNQDLYLFLEPFYGTFPPGGDRLIGILHFYFQTLLFFKGLGEFVDFLMERTYVLATVFTCDFSAVFSRLRARTTSSFIVV